MDKTPIKIIAIIVIPLIIALIVKYTGSDFKSSDKVLNSKGETVQENVDKDNQIKIMTSWPLPENLKEISGISWIDADHFACVQDEKGTVFIYNLKSSSIDNEIEFAGKGDYEGVAVVGNTIYVLQANGTIFEILNYTAAKPTVKLYETHLKKKQDSESLAYDRKHNRLLVAIKGEESKDADYKGIYAFDLKSKTMNSEPVFRIDLKDEVFKDEKSNGKAIQPSDIEVHPLTDEIYIIEGTKPKLLILNSNGTVKSLYKLKKSDFAQPEGLSFNPDGLLYIANEGRDNPGNILQVELLEK